MAFYTERFPVDISFGAEGGPTYRTDVVETDGGYEYRNQNWEQSRLRWDVAQAARTGERAAKLLSFFRQVRGRTNAFRFKDWADYQVPDNAGEGIFGQVVGESPDNVYQMYKRYGSGALLENRKITRPVDGTVTVYGGTVASIDYDTGLVTMTSGIPTAWTGEFDVPCRFDIDDLKQTLTDRNLSDGIIITASDIPIIEVRE